MDKLKLVRIIAKDLEELKTLTEEFAENEDGSPLIIDLALSRARLLCQELEVLRNFSTPVSAVDDEIENENFEDDENEASDLNASDPELEILHFEDQDFPEEEEITEEEEEKIVYDAEEDEEEENIEEEEYSEENDLTEEEEAEEEFGVEDSEEDDEDFQEESEEDIEEEIASIEEEETEFDEEKAIEYEEQEEASLEEAKRAVQQAVREIELNDLDDEEDESIQFTPASDSSRPVMREIPKPEGTTPEIPFTEKKEPEKMTYGESVQKERSINEVIGENKSAETNLTSGSISSLKATIGLNDRFLFIREIFNNNSEKYNTIIDQLDKMETIQQAVDYLKVNLSLQKNETSLKFVELLKRRFSK